MMKIHSIALVSVLLAWSGTAAAERLPLVAVPQHYTLTFSPDLAKETFEGHASIRMQVLTPTARFVVHAADLTIQEVTVVGGGLRQAATVKVDAAAETVTIEVPVPLAPMNAELDIRYTGRLNRELRGFYISEANGRKYAVTQLEATDARRMFPSFDEPGFKATFDVSAVIDEGDYAISNGPVTRVEPGPSRGKKTMRFGTTARMSTYLVALAVGDFLCTESRVGDTPVRVCSTPDKRELTAFAAEATRVSLDYFNRYFAIDYPFQKLDLVAIPDFAAGAMENTGAVFFRESLLLVANDASLATRKRAALVIAHELAHQWFGNLVTMQWWDDLWLNEGFATWMETKAIAAWKPEWHVELDELQATHGAMAVDALRSTRPVRIAADTPAQIEALFDPIAYEKGAAILGMVESFVGEEGFRGGVNAYLHEHQYDNATAEDFWAIVTRATGKPVDRIMRTFVDRPGVPLVTVETGCQQDSTVVTLSQERFRQSAAAAPAGEPWVIPVCLETPGNEPGNRCQLLDSSRATVTLAGCHPWVVGNAGAAGYYRTQHGTEALRGIETANASLAPDERLMLIGDEWALLRGGRSGVDRFLGLTSSLADDLKQPAVLSAVGARLQFIREYLATEDAQEPFEAWVRDRFGPALDDAQQAPSIDEIETRRLAALLGIAGAVGRDAQVLAEARRKVDHYLSTPRGRAMDANTLDALVALAALAGDAPLYDRYQAAAEKADTPEQRYRFLYALPAFRDPALVRRTIEYALSPAVRAQDRASLLGRVLGNPAAREQAWRTIQTRWADLQAGLGAFGGTSRIIESLGAFCDRRHVQEIAGFFEAHPVPNAQRALAQTLEDIEACAALVESQQPTLTSALERR